MRIPVPAIILNNEAGEICARCKGSCCKRYAGMVYPEQLPEVTEQSLMDMLDRGYIFDSWEGNPTSKPEHNPLTAYFLRPRHTNDEPEDFYSGSWGGICSFLTDKGCKLKFEQRPLVCQNLTPKEVDGKRECFNQDEKISKQGSAIAWLPYNDIIVNVLKKKRNESE